MKKLLLHHSVMADFCSTKTACTFQKYRTLTRFNPPNQPFGYHISEVKFHWSWATSSCKPISSMVANQLILRYFFSASLINITWIYQYIMQYSWQCRDPIQIPKWEIKKLSNKFALQPMRECVGIFRNIYSARTEQYYKLANGSQFSDNN